MRDQPAGLTIMDIAKGGDEAVLIKVRMIGYYAQPGGLMSFGRRE
jgi:hypothetical protein